jgi:lipoate-protein ligase A
VSLSITFFNAQVSSPAENLAADEALLDLSENSGQAFLRFWESERYFVVLGYGKKIADETFHDQCDALGIPILRRCSGGGTVLQGPGCLNYSLFLPIDAAPELETISGANRYTMQRIRAAVERATNQTVDVKGHTDLTLDGRKFSGNAQRRKRRTLLFHGAFLLNFDLQLIATTLRPPKEQPEYRANRDHLDFLINLQLDANALQGTLREEWGVTAEADPSIRQSVISDAEKLAVHKYATADWNERY